MTTIYQLFLKQEQVTHLNPGFMPVVFSDDSPGYYRSIKKCYELSKESKVDLWGCFPWDYKFKFASGGTLSENAFLEHINANPGYDVYFFNPLTNHVPVVYNVWEQGAYCHSHIINIMEQLFPLMGIDVDILYQPQTAETMFWNFQCVGNKKFWDGYFKFTERYINALNELSDEIKQLVFNENYFSFIEERLMPTYIAAEVTELKVLPYYYGENTLSESAIKLNELKHAAIQHNDVASLDTWCNLRIKEKNRIYSDSAPDLASIWKSKFHDRYAPQTFEFNINGKKGYMNNGLLKFLRNNIQKNSTLLDLGCGPKLYSNPLKDKCSTVVTIDAWANVQPDIVVDLEVTDLNSVVTTNFDYILMIDFIEHLNKDAGKKLIEQCKKIANKKIFLLTPLPEIWTTNHENVDNESLWCYNNEYDLHKSTWTDLDFIEWNKVNLPGLSNYYVGYYTVQK